MNVDDYKGEGVLPTLYSKTATGKLQQWTCWVEGPEVCTEWGVVGGKLQTARFVCEPKNVGRANATTAEQQAVAEAIAAWHLRVKKKYHWDPAHWESNINHKPMLAKNFGDAKKLAYPVLVQPKYDGVRNLSRWLGGDVSLQSRGGDPYDVAHIRDTLRNFLPTSIEFDGELYHHGTPLQDITSWVKRPQELSANLVYMVYDQCNTQMGFEERFDQLRQLFGSEGRYGNIILAPTYTATSAEAVRELHDQFVELGYEGAIVRTMQGKYKFGLRSSDLLKLKAFDDAEFTVVGYTHGKGKFENVPIFTMELQNEHGTDTFEAVPRGTDETRAAMLRDAASYVGKRMTVRYLGFTAAGKPRCATIVGVREASES